MTALKDATKTPPFRRGGDNVLIEALNDHQRFYEAGRVVAKDTPQAISTGQVRDVLYEMGMEEGLDETATELFFGAEGRDGYSDGNERFAIDTYGGFVFRDLEQGDIYTITAARSSGSSVSQSRREIPRRTDNPSYLGELRRSLNRSLANKISRGRRTNHNRVASPSALSWSVSARAMCYEVQPRFYKPLDSFDFLPLAEHVSDAADAGLLLLYPPQTKGRVCTGSGAITADSAEEAISLAENLGAIMASHGVLCDPRVVLMETLDLPLLPHQARNESLYETRVPAADSEADDEDDLLPYSAFLGEPDDLLMERDYGHRVRKRRSVLVPDQSKAGWLACKASEYSAYEDRVRDLQARLEDPAIPERRKESLRHHLGRDAAIRDQCYEALADETHSIAGLLLSVFDERRELARDATLRRMGV